jgi:hypothetical protein
MGLISNGTTIFDAGALDSGLAKGAMTFIKKLTASSSATLSFVDGASGVVLDDTYKEYVFTFKDIHPETDAKYFTFQTDTGSNTNYNQTITGTFFSSFHPEDNSSTALGYGAGDDQAQGTAFNRLTGLIGNENDESGCGTLKIFNPSSTTFVKNFISTTQYVDRSPATVEIFTAGYFNTTTALNKVQFKMNSGNIDAGDICLYGIA